jgi:hypothetical protein
MWPPQSSSVLHGGEGPPKVVEEAGAVRGLPAKAGTHVPRHLHEPRLLHRCAVPLLRFTEEEWDRAFAMRLDWGKWSRAV